jgi:hypothetical protein
MMMMLSKALGFGETDLGRSRLLMAHVPQIKVGSRETSCCRSRGDRRMSCLSRVTTTILVTRRRSR